MQSIAYTKKLACYNKKMSLFHALLVQIQFKYSSLEKKNCQMDSKNRQNLKLHNSSYLMTTKKIASKTLTRTSLCLKISKNPSKFSETSSDMARFVNYIHDNFCKFISNFYHRLPI